VSDASTGSSYRAVVACASSAYSTANCAAAPHTRQLTSERLGRGDGEPSFEATSLRRTDAVARMPLHDITISRCGWITQYSYTHSAASILRCWTTWNVVCTVAQVGRKGRESLLKALPTLAIAAALSDYPFNPACACSRGVINC
jgi:hypothetical protein